MDRQRNAPTYGAMVCLSPLSSAFFSSPLPNSYSFFPTLPPHLALLALGVFCEGKPFLEFSKAAKTGKSFKPTLSTLLTPLLAHVRTRSLAHTLIHTCMHATLSPKRRPASQGQLRCNPSCWLTGEQPANLSLACPITSNHLQPSMARQATCQE